MSSKIPPKLPQGPHHPPAPATGHAAGRTDPHAAPRTARRPLRTRSALRTDAPDEPPEHALQADADAMAHDPNEGHARPQAFDGHAGGGPQTTAAGLRLPGGQAGTAAAGRTARGGQGAGGARGLRHPGAQAVLQRYLAAPAERQAQLDALFARLDDGR